MTSFSQVLLKLTNDLLHSPDFISTFNTINYNITPDLLNHAAKILDKASFLWFWFTPSLHSGPCFVFFTFVATG